VDALDRFLDDLASARIGTTFNQYRDADPAFDRPGAAQIRLGNLAAYLRARPHPSLMLVGEAAGYAGCRFSGIAFTSERCLPRDRWTSVDDPNGHVELSASIVHRVLWELDLEADTVLWNLCPTHPARSNALSNRTPTRDERRAGVAFLTGLVDLLQPALVLAVGVHAGRALPDERRLRHPAHGGASEFRLGLVSAMASRH
jgi:uracil-DNA glycosylase